MRLGLHLDLKHTVHATPTVVFSTMSLMNSVDDKSDTGVMGCAGQVVELTTLGHLSTGKTAGAQAVIPEIFAYQQHATSTSFPLVQKPSE